MLSFRAKSRNLSISGRNKFRPSSVQKLKSAIRNSKMSIYRRVLGYYRPFLWQTIFGLCLALIGIGLNLLNPWPFKIIVDDFLRAAPSIFLPIGFAANRPPFKNRRAPFSLKRRKA